MPPLASTLRAADLDPTCDFMPSLPDSILDQQNLCQLCMSKKQMPVIKCLWVLWCPAMQ
jgi:hypothetical protein